MLNDYVMIDILNLVRRGGLEPPRLAAHAPQAVYGHVAFANKINLFVIKTIIYVHFLLRSILHDLVCFLGLNFPRVSQISNGRFSAKH